MERTEEHRHPQKIIEVSNSRFICPKCKKMLTATEQGLVCEDCEEQALEGWAV